MYSDPSGFAATQSLNGCNPKNGGEKDSKGDSSSIVEIVDKEKGAFIIKDWSADPYYANNRLEIHEIEPVKMGGSPTDINNKTAIQSQVHRRYVTPWWNKIRDEVKKGLD